MNGMDPSGGQRFTRSSDRGIIGGVCAGLADYFGFNLTATRFLAILSLLFAFPLTMLAYFAAVLLVPAEPTQRTDPKFRQSLRSSPRQTMTDVRARFRTLDRRLARLERYVTSSRYQLDREFRNLEKE
ncbi:MAG: envelope stress response membrane protein PspC [Pseudomonadota bacterium]